MDIKQCNLDVAEPLHQEIQTRILARSERYNYSLIRVRSSEVLQVHQSTGDIGIFVVEGTGRLILRQDTRKLAKGDFVFIKAHTLQEIEAVSDLSLLHILTH